MAPRRLTCVQAIAAVAAAAACGAGSPAERVVGGSAIQVQQAPWAVFVQQNGRGVAFICTGEVIDASHVVTAGHCVFNAAGTEASPSLLQVRAGISNFLSPLSTDAEQDRSVSAIRVHPGYTRDDMPSTDDIAVLTLATPLDLSGPAVQAIALPTAGSPYPGGASVSLAGFGEQQAGSDPNGTLDSMTLTVDPQGSCGQTGAGLIGYNGIVVCASAASSATCNGDSGAGLVTTAGTPILVGITSTGIQGCPIGSRSVFTYLGAPEILDFVAGNDNPPVAPRGTLAFVSLAWHPPLVPGATIRCSTGRWDGTPTFAYSFVDAADGQVLQQGASSRYLLGSKSVGTRIYCLVAATNPGGTTLAESQTLPAVARPPNVRITPIAPLTGAPGAALLVAVAVESPAGLTGTVKACVTLAAADGGRLCHSSQNAAGAAGTFRFRFAFRLRTSAPPGRSRIAVQATAGVSRATATAELRVS